MKKEEKKEILTVEEKAQNLPTAFCFFTPSGINTKMNIDPIVIEWKEIRALFEEKNDQNLMQELALRKMDAKLLTEKVMNLLRLIEAPILINMPRGKFDH